MATTHESQALDRLRQFDPPEPSSGSPAPPPHELERGSGSAALAVSILFPGAASLRRRPITAVLLFAIGVLAPLVAAAWLYINRGDIVGVALDPDVLLVVMAVSLGAVVARLLAVLEVSRAHRRSPGIQGRTIVATLVVLVMGIPAYWVTYHAYGARSAVAAVFSGGSSDPLFTPTADDPAVDPNEITNILLFGGDAGPGRWGLRTDTMILVSIHDASGRTALVSIPRNLTRLQFPPGSPLAAQYPDGFDDIANAVFPRVSTNPELMEYYGDGGLQAEAVALSEALGYSLGIEIDDFALVNMQGFTEVIDAVGGVTLDLDSSVPLPPSLPGERPLPPSIGPGAVEMDGAMAIAYARSRSADSDYGRMGRQRQLLAAIGSQVSPSDALGAFGTVTGVLDDSMRTSLSSGEFSELLDQLGDNSAIQESVGLVPPLINPGSPDYDEIRTIISAVQRGLITNNPSGYAN
jgi:LCP family protein required for cell wall assembly